eukprot:scaffold53443_cov17-Tisochrysis_lutea.AAC.1
MAAMAVLAHSLDASKDASTGSGHGPSRGMHAHVWREFWSTTVQKWEGSWPALIRQASPHVVGIVCPQNVPALSCCSAHLLWVFKAKGGLPLPLLHYLPSLLPVFAPVRSNSSKIYRGCWMDTLPEGLEPEPQDLESRAACYPPPLTQTDMQEVELYAMCQGTFLPFLILMQASAGPYSHMRQLKH